MFILRIRVFLIRYGSTFFDFVSDTYTGNLLVTTIKVHKNLNMALFSADISVGFSLKNTSAGGDLYTSGTVTQLEVSNPSSAISNVSATILPTTISSGQSADFNFSATINRRNLKSNAYYKYAITYDVNGIKKYFFYTINILTE